VILYEDEKFLRIYETLRGRRGGQEYAHLWRYPEGWNLLGGMDGHYRAFADDLRRANIITWNRQYEDDQQPLRTLDPHPALPYETDIRFLKSLRGLRYNLIDNAGNETDLCDCLKKLDALIDEVAMDIIRRLPEWERANTW
jgi:hypothetical protein